MRIVGGQWRGRSIKPPKGTSTRPTTDRVREALFNALASRMGADLSGARALDAFAGSGALGLEALSRGATHSTFIEKRVDALGALRSNVEQLSASRLATVRGGDVFSLAERLAGGPFTLILLDPPYTLDHSEIRDLLGRLRDAGAVEDGAWVTWEHSSGEPALWPHGFEVDCVKKYGSTEIDIARFERGTPA